MPYNFDSIKQWYDRYTGSFCSEDEETEGALRLKEQHCKRVMGEIINIAGALELSCEERAAAAIAGLLHDIGRFEQFVKYHTFLDIKSVNHAELAVSILKRENVLGELPKSGADSILQAIEVHNKAQIDQDSPILCKMLRDADKLDIWNVVLLHFESGGGNATKSVELDFPDIDIVSDNVLSAILKSVPWEIKAMASVNDFKMLVMSWVFDLNFPFTFKQVLERRYLPRLFATLPQTEECRQVFEHCMRYLKSKNNINGECNI